MPRLSFKNVVISIQIIILAGCVLSNAASFEDDLSITLDQKTLLDEFKGRVLKKMPTEYMKADIYLLKWLRQSSFDVNGAETKLINSLNWRKKQGLDSVKKEDFSDMRKEFKYYLDGRDKSGRPILYVEMGSWDMRGISVQGRRGRFIRYMYSMLDETSRLVQNLGRQYKNVTRGQLLVNADALAPCGSCGEFLAEMMTSARDNFPELFDKMIVVNGKVNVLADAIGPKLNRELQADLKYYGKNKGQWKPALSKDFDFDKLPPALGGSQLYSGMEEYDY